MRCLVPLSILLLAASCGGGDVQTQQEDLRTYDVQANPASPAPVAPATEGARAPSGPNVAPTASPTLKRETPLPTALTLPTISCPGTHG